MTPRTVTVTRLHHALEGKVLRILGTMRRHGEEELLLELPDGSKLLLPAAWTDLSGATHLGASTSALSATLGRLDDLLQASRLARAAIPDTTNTRMQAARKPPTKEDDRAACTLVLVASGIEARASLEA